MARVWKQRLPTVMEQVQIYTDTMNGDSKSVRRKQRKLIDIRNAVCPCADTTYAVGTYVLQWLGICSARVTSPRRMVSPSQGRSLDATLRGFADVPKA